MRESKRVIFAAVIAILLIIIYIMSDGSENDKNTKPTVALSTFALYDVAKHITGDTLNLISIIPPGVDIHTYEPTPKTMAQISDSDLVVYSGSVLEPWIASYKFNNRSIGITDFINIRELEHNEFDTHAHHDEQCAHNTLDPHYWLDVENMIKVTNILTYELIGIAPQHKELFIKNRDSYLLKLKNIDKEYKAKLDTCMLDTIIVNHNAFTYLANRYNFHVESLTGLSPETEVTPKDVIRVIDHVKHEEVRTVFCENFVNGKNMQSLAKDAHVKLDNLHTLGNISSKEFENHVTYEEIMLENLDKISKALVCR